VLRKSASPTDTMSALRTGWIGAWTGVDCVSHFIFSFVLGEGRITANGSRARLFLRRKPFLHAASSIKHRAAHTCSWRSYAKRVPTVERALVPLQLSSEFFSCHKFCEDRYQLGHGGLLRTVTRAYGHIRAHQVGGSSGKFGGEIPPYLVERRRSFACWVAKRKEGGFRSACLIASSMLSSTRSSPLSSVVL